MGSTLTVVPGAYRPANPTIAVQWLRDGQPIPGATGASYRVRVADLGARVSASVTATRTGFSPAPVATGQTRAVRVVPRMKIERVTGRHSTRLVIRVVARGVPVVTGAVRVRVQGGFRQEVALRNGVARVVLKGLPQGKRNARIAYVGSSTVTKLVRKLAVRLPAPKG